MGIPSASRSLIALTKDYAGNDKSSDSPKKRKRGRPLKDPGSSSVSEERRLQTRRAQESYRNRREAATKALEHRVAFLEDSLEDISNNFINFTESILKAKEIRENPEILQELLTVASNITRVAKEASQKQVETSEDGQADAIRPSREELVLATAEKSSASVHESSGGFNSLTSNLVVPSGHPSEVFGNGWFGLTPSLSHLSFRGATPSDPDGEFAYKLVQTTLNMAFNSLIEYRNESTSFVMRMCRYALLYHSIEEILFNLRWFLGPGFLAIPALSRANFGFEHTLSAQAFNAIASSNEAKIFSPFVDAQALVESPTKNSRLAFMNALDVEEYLRSKGAVYLDEDIVQFPFQGSFEAEGIEQSVLDDQFFNQMVRPTEQNIFETSNLTPMEPYLAPNSSPTELQTPSFLGNGVDTCYSNPDTATNALDFFDFDALLEAPAIQSRQTGQHIPARPRIVSVRPQTVFLCRSSLLENLARCSICLGTGPAYPRASVDTAIESAIVRTPVC